MYEVNFSGQEVKFASYKDAVDFQDDLDVGSDIWDITGGQLVLKRTRIDLGWGLFKVEDM
jgi:hypothetical protein